MLIRYYSSSSLALSLGNGGTAGLFWTYAVSSIGLGLAYASVAELGSMSVLRQLCCRLLWCFRLPTSGGQYFWVAVLAPRSCRRYLSYITGEWSNSPTFGLVFQPLV
jgi:hypothetical protein